MSFGTILVIMAALLVGAAILIFVAANWDAMPRVLRVGVLFSTILIGYLGGTLLKLAGNASLGEALWLIAAAAFGGSIALIGQMYHLSGDEEQAVLTWCAGTTLAAVMLRSGPLTVAAVALASAWLFLVGISFWRDADFPHLFLGIAAVQWLASYWTRSVVARHLLLLSLVLYAFLLAIDLDALRVGSVLAALSAALFGIAVAWPKVADNVVRVDGLLPAHALIGFLAGMVVIQMEIGNDSGAAFATASAVALAGIVAAVVLAGRENRGLRWIAYIGFALELCLIYATMIQGMLGTAGFFLAAGTILGVLAVVITRIEKRMGAPIEDSGAPL